MASGTRNNSSCQLSVYLGVGSELIQYQLPTVRGLLRYGLLQRELSNKDKRNIPVEDIVQVMFDALTKQWEIANSKFKSPVINHERTIKQKIQVLWEQAIKFLGGKGRVKVKEKF